MTNDVRQTARGADSRFFRVLLVSAVLAATLMGVVNRPAFHQAEAATSTMYTSDYMLASPRGSAATVITFAERVGSTRLTDTRAYINEIYRLCTLVGLDPSILIAQSALETGYWRDSIWTQSLNPAGMGIYQPDTPSYVWPDGTSAARAHVVHVYMYVTGRIPQGHILYGYIPLDPGYERAIAYGAANSTRILKDLEKYWATMTNYAQYVANKGNEIYGTQLTIGSGGVDESDWGTSPNSSNPARARDGDTNTSWARVGTTTNPPSSATLQFAFASPTQMTTIRWIFRVAGYADEYRIRVSADGATWRTIALLHNPRAAYWYSLSTGETVRYIRFSFSNPNRDKALGYLAEVEFFGGDPKGPVTVTPPSTPGPTPTVAPPTGPALRVYGSGGSAGATYTGRVWDNNLTTDWHTTTSPAPSAAYVYIDLGNTGALTKIGWVFNRTGAAGWMHIQVSSDKSNWTTLRTVGDAPANVWQYLGVSTSARYVRLFFENVESDPVVGYVAELRAWGTAREPAAQGITPTATVTPTGTTEATGTATEIATETAVVTETAVLPTEPLPTDAAIPTEVPTETPTETPTVTPIETATEAVLMEPTVP